MQTKRDILYIIILLLSFSCYLLSAQTKNAMKKEWPPLPKALDEGRFDDAKKYLTGNKDPHFRGSPLILFFADNGSCSQQIIEFLIANKVNKKHYGEALIQTVSYGDFESVNRLLAAGADINTKTNINNSFNIEGFSIKPQEGKNSLYFITREDIGKYLIDNGIEVEEDSIFAVAYNNYPLLKALISAGYKGPKISKEEANKYLFKASLLGDAQATQFFIDKGADVNALTPNINGENNVATPLIINTFQGYSQPNYGIEEQVSPDVAKILIDAGADTNIKDKNGKTAFHYTCEIQMPRIYPQTRTFWSRQRGPEGHGHPRVPMPYLYDLVGEVLINAGTNINTTDNNGNTPLILAVKNRRYEMVKKLLEAGAKTDIKNKAGEMPFDFASDYITIAEICKTGYPLKLSTEYLNTMLKGIFQNNFLYEDIKIDKEAFSNLIRMGADINTIVEDRNRQNILTCLIENKKYQKPEEIDLPFYLDLGIDVNTKGKSALMYAAERANYSKEYTALLLQYGADINAKNNNSVTALTIARSEKNLDAAALLEAAGAKRDINAEWWYALCKGWQEEDLKSLVAEGANIDAQTTHSFTWDRDDISGDGVSALMYLAKRWRVKPLKALLKMGANASLKDKNGMTALHHAAGGSQGWWYMKTSVGSIHDKDVNDIIPLLIKAGAEPNTKDNEGKTAKDYADKNHMIGISEALAKYTKP